jgi:O-antigen ligase
MVLYNASGFSTPKKVITILSFVIVFLTLILTGTRAGFLVFLIAIFLYQVLGIKSKKFSRYIFTFGIILLIALVIVSTQVNLARLFDRYSYEMLVRMISIRYELYYGSIADLTFLEFLVGRADLSVLDSVGEVESERFINPHNVFLSLIRFNGLLPFLIFFCVFVILPINYYKIYKLHYKKDRFRIMETTMIIFLAMTFVNVMASGGRITRNFFLFFTIAYFIGYIDLLRSNPKVEEYKKMIL